VNETGRPRWEAPAVRAHAASVELDAPPERVFRALVTPTDLRAFWGAARAVVLAEPGGAWIAAWGDDEDRPDYLTAATIREYDPPRRLVLSDYRYRAKSGPLPFAAAFVTSFDLASTPRGARLTVTQHGFPCTPAGDVFYAACEQGWKVVLDQLARHVVARP